jgi:hypothetical protein
MSLHTPHPATQTNTTDNTMTNRTTRRHPRLVTGFTVLIERLAQSLFRTPRAA